MSEEAIERLHGEYARLTGRKEHIRFHDRSWWYLLHEIYRDDAEAMLADVETLVRYLKREIARGKRNAGCLKLFNFLQPDRFDADLAEARVMMKPRRPAAPVTAAAPAERKEAEPDDAAWEEQASAARAAMQEARRKLRGAP